MYRTAQRSCGYTGGFESPVDKKYGIGKSLSTWVDTLPLWGSWHGKAVSERGNNNPFSLLSIVNIRQLSTSHKGAVVLHNKGTVNLLEMIGCQEKEIVIRLL